MKNQYSFLFDCENIYNKITFYLKISTSYTEENNTLSYDDLITFNDLLNSLRTELHMQIAEHMEVYQNPIDLYICQAIVDGYTASFVNLINLEILPSS